MSKSLNKKLMTVQHRNIEMRNKLFSFTNKVKASDVPRQKDTNLDSQDLLANSIWR